MRRVFKPIFILSVLVIGCSNQSTVASSSSRFLVPRPKKSQNNPITSETDLPESKLEVVEPLTVEEEELESNLNEVPVPQDTRIVSVFSLGEKTVFTAGTTPIEFNPTPKLLEVQSNDQEAGLQKIYELNSEYLIEPTLWVDFNPFNKTGSDVVSEEKANLTIFYSFQTKPDFQSIAGQRRNDSVPSLEKFRKDHAGRLIESVICPKKIELFQDQLKIDVPLSDLHEQSYCPLNLVLKAEKQVSMEELLAIKATLISGKSLNARVNFKVGASYTQESTHLNLNAFEIKVILKEIFAQLNFDPDKPLSFRELTVLMQSLMIRVKSEMELHLLKVHDEELIQSYLIKSFFQTISNEGKCDEDSRDCFLEKDTLTNSFIRIDIKSRVPLTSNVTTLSVDKETAVQVHNSTYQSTLTSNLTKNGFQEGSRLFKVGDFIKITLGQFEEEVLQVLQPGVSNENTALPTSGLDPNFKECHGGSWKFVAPFDCSNRSNDSFSFIVDMIIKELESHEQKLKVPYSIRGPFQQVADDLFLKNFKTNTQVVLDSQVIKYHVIDEIDREWRCEDIRPSAVERNEWKETTNYHLPSSRGVFHEKKNSINLDQLLQAVVIDSSGKRTKVCNLSEFNVSPNDDSSKSYTLNFSDKSSCLVGSDISESQVLFENNFSTEESFFAGIREIFWNGTKRFIFGDQIKEISSSDEFSGFFDKVKKRTRVNLTIDVLEL